jgi:hypothetical protein
MLSFITNTLSPYARPASIAAKIATLGYTGYGVRQILSKDNDDGVSPYGGKSLSTLYLLHMATISLTTAVLFGQIDVSPALATAGVALSALLKGYAELCNEEAMSQHLMNQKTGLDSQLKKRNIEFERMLVILEDLTECQNDLKQQNDHIIILKSRLLIRILKQHR